MPPRARRPAERKTPQSPTTPIVPAAVPQASPAPAAGGNTLLLRGEYWEISFEGRTALVEDCRGLRYIALLIRDSAGQHGPIHAKELVARASGEVATPIEIEAREPVLDALAETQLVKRVEEIGFARNRASAVDDFDTMAALDEEYERIAEQLSRQSGKAGRRGATFGDGAEKARKAVGKAIGEAVGRIASHAELSGLAAHLTRAIRKGQWLSYNDRLPWRVEFQPPLRRK